MHEFIVTIVMWYYIFFLNVKTHNILIKLSVDS